jgi:RNA polymerase sigma-70 factor, ECF subfamily
MTVSDSAASELRRAEGVPRDQASAGHELPTFETIYQQYFHFVWSSSLRLGVNSSSIDDVVQEVFMVIHARISTLEQPGSLRSWIYGITRRVVSRHRRLQKTRVRSAGDLAIQIELEQSRPPTPLELKERNEKVKLLYSLLDEISWPKREVLILAEMEEMSVPEIAEALEIPLNTAYSRLRAARRVFEQRLARRRAKRDEGSK